MKSGREYRSTFHDEVRKMINDQVVEYHTHDFVSDYSGHHINPDSIRKLFRGFQKGMTSHGLHNLFQSWADNHDVPKFLANRYCDHALEGLDKA